MGIGQKLKPAKGMDAESSKSRIPVRGNPKQ